MDKVLELSELALVANRTFDLAGVQRSGDRKTGRS